MLRMPVNGYHSNQKLVFRGMTKRMNIRTIKNRKYLAFTERIWYTHI